MTVKITKDQIFNEDCLPGMKRLPPECVDLIITDPPFGIDFQAQRANYNRKGSKVLAGYREIDSDNYYDFSRDWLGQAYRLLKPSGSAFVFSGWNHLKDILNAIDEVGFTTINHIIWKYQFGVNTRRRFISSHYHCLFLCKNEKQRKFFPNARYPNDARGMNGGSLRYRDMEDVWEIKREYWSGDLKTPTKLPAEIVKKLLEYASEPNDLVLDPFLGSGQVAFVSKQMGRHYLGFEIVPIL